MDFRFAEPQLAQAFWLLAAALLLVFWLEQRGGADLARLVGPALQDRLVMRPAAWRRRARTALLGLSAACAILGLMRPQWGMRFIASQRVGAEIMICLDVSRSMLAEDVAPSRLERAKAEITDLLSYLDNDHVGLIAFAGRATVLSPLTPDFGFLRLVLDNAGPRSVTRGGTRLEEPLRKALAGFGPPGRAARAILLFTDGEDHESFALDAAKAAAELGVRIVAVGFGDEGGSEIYVRDARTGARTLLRDDDGSPVRTRLDGDLLRDLALTTQGVYVPAGTGLLDLEAIYEEHIAPLTWAGGDAAPRRGQTQREEAYQWALLLALIFLVAGVAVAAGGGAAPTLLALTLGIAGSEVRAQDTAPDSTAEVPQASATESPRELHNRGLAALAEQEFEDAQMWLGRARRDARDDGELRLHASYNLGLVSVARSDAQREANAAEALASLHEASDWFRRAVQLDPGDTDSRTNLEVTLRRALLLADELARSERQRLAERLGALAQSQREQSAAVAQVLDVLPADGPAVAVAAPVRRAFRDRATAQRLVLADADDLARSTADERDGLEEVPEAERTQEDQMRAVQLTNVLHYLHRSRERMGQARRQLRQRQGPRAYRRTAAALDDLKRALDQLRDPVAALDAILREATRLAVATNALAGARTDFGTGDASELAAWLTPENLSRNQGSVAERAAELNERLLAGTAGEPPPEATAAQLRQLEGAREAQPLVARGAAALSDAAVVLESERLEPAMRQQREGIRALLDARERFLDLRGLIEAAYSDQLGVSGLLVEERELIEYYPGLLDAQRKNLGRTARLAQMLQDEESALAADSPELERFAAAATVLELVRGDMLGAETALADASRSAATRASDAAVAKLQALRRIFFSIVEHLRDTAEQQLELNDASRDARTLEPGLRDAGPDGLSARQSALAERAEALALELEEQSRQQERSESAGEAPGESDAAMRLREAGEHVLTAETEMLEAALQLAGEPSAGKALAAAQDAVVRELAEAIALLVPPEQQQDQQGQQNSEDTPQPDRPQEPQAADADPSQLLQEVRDREARRRRDRAASNSYDAVGRDW
jgi:Ca-activated chloride channel family protein